MTKHLLIRMGLAIALGPVCGYAVDGQILINQSTVMSAGGFPYIISQPGSYKLSGNLVATTGASAIQIGANNVIVDLNGFNVSCAAQQPIIMRCVTDAGTGGFQNIEVGNGTVSVSLVPGGTPPPGFNFNYGVDFSRSMTVYLHDVFVLGFQSFSLGYGWGGITVGYQSRLDRNTASLFEIYCPSIYVENITTGGGGLAGGSGCVGANNLGFSGLVP